MWRSAAAADDDQTVYCVGSEAGASLGFYRGELFKKFPLLWRRPINHEERKELVQRGIIESYAPPSMTLMKYEEYVNLISNKGYLFKNSSSAGQNSDAKRPKTSGLGLPTTPTKRPSGNNFNFGAQPCFVAPLTPLVTARLNSETKIRTENMLDHNDFSRLKKYTNPDARPEWVPIKLDLEINTVKLRDVFVWDKNDSSLTPEMFATIECEDFDLNPSTFFMPIVESIQSQLDSYVPPKEMPSWSSTPDIIQIKIDIPIGYTCLTDCFEWNANSEDPCAPEEFAKKTTAELGLGGEFACVIAYSIRSQVLQHHKQKCLGASFANTNQSSNSAKIYREDYELEVFGPKLEILTEEELQRKLANVERNFRRARRSTLLNF